MSNTDPSFLIHNPAAQIHQQDLYARIDHDSISPDPSSHHTVATPHFHASSYAESAQGNHFYNPSAAVAQPSDTDYYPPQPLQSPAAPTTFDQIIPDIPHANRPVLPNHSYTDHVRRLTTPRLRQSASFAVGPSMHNTVTPPKPDSGTNSPRNRLSDDGRMMKKRSVFGFMNNVIPSPRKLTVSHPINPVHVTHVGFDQETGSYTVGLFFHCFLLRHDVIASICLQSPRVGSPPGLAANFTAKWNYRAGAEEESTGDL